MNYVLTDGNDLIDGTDLADSVTFIGGAGFDQIRLGRGDDVVDGRSDRVSLDAGSGDDTISYTAGDRSRFDGGYGNDRMILTSTQSDERTTTRVFGGDGDDHIELIGNAHGIRVRGGYGDDVILGSAGDDILDGEEGNDLVRGGEGNDFIVGEGSGDAGNDTFSLGLIFRYDSLRSATVTCDGGVGSDLANFFSSEVDDDSVVVDLMNSDRNAFRAAGHVLISIENVTGTLGRDEIYGDESANILNGAGGSGDLIEGRGGDDVLSSNSNLENPSDWARLDGGAGNDVLRGGSGGDHLDGGSGFDTASYDFGAWEMGRVLIDLADPSLNQGNARGDTYESIEAIVGTSEHGDDLRGDGGSNQIDGNGGDDVVAGRGGNDTLIGGDGDDALAGDSGNDVLRGGGGADILDGGAGVDTASYGWTHGARVDLISGANNRGDTYVSIENLIGSTRADDLRGDADANRLDGSSGDDLLFGRGGNDTLLGGYGLDKINGGAGDDLLDGGAGPDRMTGGDGADRFVLSAGRSAPDTVMDFANGLDRFVLTGNADSFADLSFTQVDADGDGSADDLSVDFGTGLFIARNTTLAQIDAADFIF